MPEVAPTLGFASALLMVLSIAIWASWLQGPYSSGLMVADRQMWRRPGLQ